ncbi:hypothetical protein K501DRAFT_280182 [Backusella circina FSU 941]|nr:hypothetical protein K501DRAFT_280182 [Backusella circina FSU 941]
MRKPNDEDLLRLQDRLKVYDQIRGNNINDVTRACSSDTIIMQPSQHQGSLSAYSRDFEHSSGQVKPVEKAVIRSNNSEKDVQLYTEKHQLSKYWTWSTDTPALVVDALRQVWLPKGMYLYPPWKLMPQVLKKVQEQKSILVPNDLKDKTPTITNHLENKSETVSSHLAIINNSKLKDGLDEQRANRDYSSTHLSTLRSSITSAFSIIHSQKQPITDQLLIKEFFTA